MTEPLSTADPAPPAAPRAPRQRQSRLTVVSLVYHQPSSGTPSGTEYRYERTLRTDEALYSRRLAPGEGWEPLDLGWLSSAGLVVLGNESRAGVLVGFALPGGGVLAALRVRPGECLPLDPVDLPGVRLRAEAPGAACTLAVVPA